MAEDVEMEVMQDKSSNACCDALNKKYSKLFQKYVKVEEIKNHYRKVVKGNFDVIERENGALKKELEELKMQVGVWKGDKEQKCGRCVDLDDEVSALKEEIRLLKQNLESVSQVANTEIGERVNASEKEIKSLKELLVEERQRAAAEKKNAELEKKKCVEALKKVEAGKKKVSEVEKVANIERKKAEDNRLSWEKIKMETDAVKLMLASERSKTEAADKKVETEKQNASRERKRADLAEARSKEQLELAETHLKKAMLEKDRADDLNRKLEARIKAEKLEELNKRLRSEKTVGAQVDISKTDKISQKMEKIILEKDHIISQEKKRADKAEAKAKKQKKVSKAQNKLAMEQKHRADKLFNELESNKLRFKDLQKELQESVSRRIYADNTPLRNNEVIADADSVKVLRKCLKLEKMLVKHASETAKVEALHNNVLHRELFHLKQESHLFQQRLEFLDKSFLHGLEGTHKLEKIGFPTSTREMLCSGGDHRPIVSGIDSGLDPPYRGSNQETLKRSAINSTSASFSDRTLVGSQGRRSSSVTTSDKLGEDISNLKPAPPRLSGKNRTRYNEHHTVAIADYNSMRSPGKKNNENVKRVGYSGKKRILDEVEPIESLYSEGKKLRQHVLEKQILMPEDVPKQNSSRKFIPPPKRRKTSREGMPGILRLKDSEEPKTIMNLGIDDPGDDIMILEGNQCLPQDSDEIAAYDYMKLLDLDDAAEESSYRKAIANPLSPMLPELEIHGDGELVLDNPEMLAQKNYPEESFNARDNPASVSTFHTVDMEMNPSSLVLNDPVTSQLLSTKEFADQLKSTGSILGTDTLLNQIHVASGALGMPDVLDSGNKVTNILCKRGVSICNSYLLRYFVVSLDHKDNASILRILQTMDSCKPYCSFLQSPVIYLQSIFNALSKAEDLSMKEKACVFFSLVLNMISEVGIRPLTDFSNDKSSHSYDSLTRHIHSALSGPVLRKLFTESCDLLELFAVIENFILQRKVFTCDSGEPVSPRGFKGNLVLNGNSITFSEVVPPSHLLVAGGSLLASFCSAVDHIGFVCEISINIITIQEFDHPVMLTILHAFARVCGSEYFTLQRYSIAMTVVKSLVMFLEKQTLLTDTTSFCPSMVENSSKPWLCSKHCPFSEGLVSMEDVALLLLEKLWNHGKSNYCPQDLLLSLTSDENVCDFTDILSLVEILASFMSWDWTFDHIISRICEHLESHPTECFSAAIYVLLGQLGSLGVSASGYEDARVKKLRGSVSAFARENMFVKSDISVQFAVITSLFRLTRIKFEEVIDGKVETPASASQSISASFIRDWFFQLSHEQQSHFRILEAGNKKC